MEQRLLGILEGLARRLDVAEGAPGRGVGGLLLGQAAGIGEGLVDQASIDQGHDGPRRDVASACHGLVPKNKTGPVRAPFRFKTQAYQPTFP